MKNKKRKPGLQLTILFALFAFLLVPALETTASEKTDALKAYSAFLSEDRILWSENDSFTVSAKNCSFALVYLDKNSVPELVLQNTTDTFHVGGFGALFAYAQGKVQYVCNLHMDDTSFYYYKKRGIFLDGWLNTGINNQYYLQFSKGITRERLLFSREILDMNQDGKKNYYSKMGSDGRYHSLPKAKFNSQRKKIVGNGKKTKAKFHENTAANRELLLK